MSLFASLGLDSAVTATTNDVVQLFHAILTATTVAGPYWPPNADVDNGTYFDFIVVGAGSAGSVLANRLSENTDWNILLIEAGGDPPVTSVIPGIMGNIIHTSNDWNYYAAYDNDTGAAQRIPGVIQVPRGKMLGGSSSINYMYYNRGNPADYDGWAADGNDGWEWENVLPYFKKSEGIIDETIMFNATLKAYHNFSGPLIVTKPDFDPISTAKAEVLLDAFEEIGIQRISDYNSGSQMGIGRSFFTHTLPPSKRCSAAEAFLVKAGKRSNLKIIKEALVTKVLIENTTAVGVEVFIDGVYYDYYTNNEVIVSAGSINTPKILVASGIGPQADVEALGITSVSDLPVGSNLKEHWVAPMLFSGASDIKTVIGTGTPVLQYDTMPLLGLTGYFSTENSSVPNIQLIGSYFGVGSPTFYGICLNVLNLNSDVCDTWLALNAAQEIYFVDVIYLEPASTGNITITGVAPDDAPVINYNMYDNSSDVDAIRDAMKFLLNLTATDTMSSFSSEFLDPGYAGCQDFTFKSDEYFDCYIKAFVNTLYHPVGTCAMGSVVNTNGTVYGLTGLRVVDASIFPTIPRGNTNAPTIMAAERISDVIKNDYA